LQKASARSIRKNFHRPFSYAGGVVVTVHFDTFEHCPVFAESLQLPVLLQTKLMPLQVLEFVRSGSIDSPTCIDTALSSITTSPVGLMDIFDGSTCIRIRQGPFFKDDS
jgi:hypothetical protein